MVFEKSTGLTDRDRQTDIERKRLHYSLPSLGEANSQATFNLILTSLTG